ncbi:MAG: S8 family peptidase [Elusimicrobia bacterium]|nr:S8 family peptidase [Elusimicrobiota bacterium]
MKGPIASLLAMLALACLPAEALAKRVIITFEPRASPEARQKILAQIGARPLGTIQSNGHSAEEFLAVVAEAGEPASAEGGLFGRFQAASLGADSHAEPPVPPGIHIEEDYNVRWIEALPAFQPPSLSPGGLGRFRSTAASFRAAAERGEITWNMRAIRAPGAWDYTEGEKVDVAVIDTGVDYSHKDLEGAVDGGYNAITDSESPESYMDDNGHGTHVAGIIGARRNGWGVVGVAPKARLYAVKVLSKDGSGNLSDVIKGLIWSANNGIQVVNMSLGSPTESLALQKAVAYAKGRGVVIVAAAGNSGRTGGAVSYPAAYPETIAVAASNSEGALADFSSRGENTKVIAPGEDVVSTRLGGDFVLLSGTSMAAPHVTGIAALLVAQGYRGLTGPDGVLAQFLKAAKKEAAKKICWSKDVCAALVDAKDLVSERAAH